MSIIEGARIIDRTNPGRRGEVMEVDGGAAAVEWRRAGKPVRRQTMAVGVLSSPRFGVLLEVKRDDLIQDIYDSGWQSVRRVTEIRGAVLLQRPIERPGGRLIWSEATTSEPWTSMTHDRWRFVDEFPLHSGPTVDLEMGDLADLVCANVVRLCEADGRTVPDIAEACWGDGSVEGKAAALGTLRRALGKPGNRDKDDHPHWPTERVVRGLVRGLRLPSMAVLFADSE